MTFYIESGKAKRRTTCKKCGNDNIRKGDIVLIIEIILGANYRSFNYCNKCALKILQDEITKFKILLKFFKGNNFKRTLLKY